MRLAVGVTNDVTIHAAQDAAAREHGVVLGAVREAVNGEAGCVRIRVEVRVPHDRQSCQVDVIAGEDALLARSAVHDAQRPWAKLQHFGQARHDAARLTAEHTRLSAPMAEQVVDQPKIGMLGQVLEDDGVGRLGGKRLR